MRNIIKYISYSFCILKMCLIKRIFNKSIICIKEFRVYWKFYFEYLNSLINKLLIPDKGKPNYMLFVVTHISIFTCH